MTADRHHHTHHAIPAPAPAAGQSLTATLLAPRVYRMIIDALVTATVEEAMAAEPYQSRSPDDNIVWVQFSHHTSRGITP